MSLLAFHSGSPKDFAVNCIYFVNIRQLDIFPAVFGFFFFGKNFGLFYFSCSPV